MKTTVWTEIKRAARGSVRLYFAPIVGAIRGIREEYRRIDAASAEKVPSTQAPKQ